jgi:hypothetical protein
MNTPTINLNVLSSDFDSSYKEEIQKTTYEYFLAHLVKWYIEEANLSSIEQFNTENNFDFTKLSLLPFFTCTANGSLEEIYSFYGNFYAFAEGPVCGIILYHLLKNDFTFFKLDSKKQLQIKENKEINNLIDVISNTEINGLKFSELQFRSKKIISAINSAILSLKKETRNKFATYSTEDLKFVARQHLSWENKYKEAGEKKKQEKKIELKDLIIELIDVKSDRKVYNAVDEEVA